MYERLMHNADLDTPGDVSIDGHKLTFRPLRLWLVVKQACAQEASECEWTQILQYSGIWSSVQDLVHRFETSIIDSYVHPDRGSCVSKVLTIRERGSALSDVIPSGNQLTLRHASRISSAPLSACCRVLYLIWLRILHSLQDTTGVA